MEKGTQTIVVVRRGNQGIIVGAFGCVFGVLGILTIGVIFVPLAALCSVIGLVRGVTGLSISGIAISLLGSVLTVTGFVFSPSLMVLAGGLVASQISAVPATKPAINTSEHEQSFSTAEAEAVKYLRKNADEGLASAQYMLGDVYQNGRGVNRDYAEALKCFRMAADQGNTSAQTSLGDMYAEGQGVGKDNAEAMRWYRRAADQGDANAQSMLGAIYAVGEGVPQDYVSALMWFNLSAAQGNKAAIEEQPKVTKRMTPEQIAEAQKLAREWKPR